VWESSGDRVEGGGGAMDIKDRKVQHVWEVGLGDEAEPGCLRE
jgi:hypothetical protein